MIAEGNQGTWGTDDPDLIKARAANRANERLTQMDAAGGAGRPTTGVPYHNQNQRSPAEVLKTNQDSETLRTLSRNAKIRQVAAKVGDAALKRAGVVGAALTAGAAFRDAVNSKYFDPTRIDRPGGMKEQILNRILNILEEKFAVLKEHLMLEANRNVIKQGRSKIIKARVRGGKIQRRKKLSAVKGFTIRKGKLVRMSPAERRKRKMGARRAKFKRKAKLARALMKRKRSLRKRAAIGLK